MEISFVILTFNSARTVKRCLDALLAAMHTLEASYEVLIVDNGSTDETCSLLDEYKQAYPYVFHIKKYRINVGTTVSRNYCLRRVTGEHIVIMDSDTYVNVAAISTLREYLLNNAGCGIVVPMITYPDGRFQLSADQVPTFLHKLKRFFMLKKIEVNTLLPPNKINKIDYAISAFWILPSELLTRVGLLDERIFYSPEDVDYCIRVWRSGLTVEQNIHAQVIHDAQEISRPKSLFKINRFTLAHIKGMFYLFIKHRYIFRSPRYINNK